MPYSKTLDYLYEQLPMFHRIGPAAYKPDLSNTLRLMDVLGKPQNKFKSIHIAGTNGKGSSSHMLAAILQKSGYKTGLYTSPHLVDFRERVRINGKMIPKNHVVDFVDAHRTAFDEIKPSFFEWTVALAFDEFAKQEVDVAVIETGLGGRLDSTNVITPIVSLITNISKDHTNLLGDTIELIAMEKAGIMKSRVPVVVSQYQSETAPLFSQHAKELKCPIDFADKNYKVTGHAIKDGHMEVNVLNRRSEESHSYVLDLTGSYQLKNLLGVLNTIEVIQRLGFIIEEEHIRAGLAHVCETTGLQGRWQTIATKPLIIADTGHNEDGVRQVVQQLSQWPAENLHMVIGAVNDKDINSMLSQLPHAAHYYFVKAAIPRALPSEELAQLAAKHKLKGSSYSTVEEGLKAARKAAHKSDVIFIGGSTFVVGDALALYSDNKS